MAEDLLMLILEGVGKSWQERLFRMNVTLCLHRAASEEEKAMLPPEWEGAPGGLAGGPVELLRVTGMPVRDAAKPCERPRRETIIPGRPDLWFPSDCKQCAPCRARAKIAGEIVFR